MGWSKCEESAISIQSIASIFSDHFCGQHWLQIIKMLKEWMSSCPGKNFKLIKLTIYYGYYALICFVEYLLLKLRLLDFQNNSSLSTSEKFRVCCIFKNIFIFVICKVIPMLESARSRQGNFLWINIKSNACHNEWQQCNIR